MIEDGLKQLDREGYGSVKIASYVDVLRLGEKSSHAGYPPKPEDIAILMYTSGSTGNYL